MTKSDFKQTPEIYTTGAYLKPLKIVDNLGNDTWVWYVSNFENDSFKDGISINPVEIANVKKHLIQRKMKSKV